MKRNNVAKKLGIASLCLATAISAFSGITSFNASNEVLAEDTGTTEFVTVSEGGKVALNGTALRISSDEAYEATFNQLFYGNIEIRYAFPERLTDFPDETAVWGNFKFTITDAADENNFFNIIYKKVPNGTAMLLEWNGHTIQCSNTATAYDVVSSDYIYDDKIDGRASYVSSPSFMGESSTRGTRTGRLTLKWGAAGNTDQLWVTTNGPQKSSDKYSVVLAKFDGSYDGSLTNKGFVEKSKWGLPKMTFPNGYKISFSSYMDVEEEDRKNATDVQFTSIVNDGKTASKAVVSKDKVSYTSFTDTSNPENNYTQAYDLMQANAGKALLGWKDAENALHSTATALKSTDISAYTPVFLGFNKFPGASLRIDTTGGQSGLRFITGFNVEDNYQDLMAAGYITSYGTLLAYTDALDDRNLTIANYGDNTADEAGQKFLKMPFGSKQGSMFEYTHQGVTYNAYSVALVNPNIKYAQSFTARGYLEVTYSGGATQIFYTNFDARSIEQTAYNLMTLGEAEFNTYGPQQKEIVRTYAAALLPAEE